MILKMFGCGYVGQVSTREVNSKTVINISVAHPEKYINKQGQLVESTTWVKCSIWKETEKLGKLLNYLVKGCKVHYEGRPDVESFVTKDAEAGASLVCQVDNFEIVHFADDEKEKPETKVSKAVEKKKKVSNAATTCEATEAFMNQ